MKRFATLVAPVLFASVIAGCDSGGIEEGISKDASPTAATDSMRSIMEKDQKNMKMKGSGRPKDVPKAVPTKDDAPAPKDDAKDAK